MKKLCITLVACCLIFAACQKAPEPIPPSLEGGTWIDLTGSINPDWHYQFDDGLLTQSYVVAGTTITTLTYPYALRDSLIVIGGDTNNPPREWAYSFECHDVLRITERNQVLNRRFWLKRE